MKNLLFAKIRSRLGLIRAPKGETILNIGVENGSDAILTNDFLANYENSTVIDFDFPKPEDADPDKYFEILAEIYIKLIAQVSENLDQNKTLVSIGGDHSISLGSLATILKVHNPKTTGVIMIDSHADIHQISTSPSGNFHGMWLRPVIDTFEFEGLDSLVPEKLPPQNLFYIGNLDIEEEERNFIESNQIETFSSEEIDSERFENKITRYLDNMEHIHISIDVDVFDHEFAPATGMMIKNGFKPEQIIKILQRFQNFKSISVDIVEVNPSLDGIEKTAELSRQLLDVLIS